MFRKLIKVMKIIVLIVVLVIVLFIIVSYINHRIHLNKESEAYYTIGNQVKVNGHMMNVYTQGNGTETLVFMSGGGTCSPVLDFKSLYTLLSDKYKIVVVEKAGYGFSENSDISRDIDTILSETREALKLSGIDGPYILCPHSMSGIEALYWAQSYPDEVRAIIGLDIAVPKAYEEYKISMPMLKVSAFAAHIGITRWIPGIDESDAIKYGTLSEQEKELYKAIFYRKTATSSMLNEVQQIKKNAQVVKNKGLPNVPLLMFCSNGEGTSWNKEKWHEFQKDFAGTYKNSTLIELNCSHYVHDIEYKTIANKIDEYIHGLKS